jgi:Ankyrin repeats (3 copies)
MALLFDRRGDQLPITEEVVKAAARNGGNGNWEVMALLFDRRGDQIPITEEVVKAAAGNWGNGKKVMALLFDRRGNQLPITEEVVKAAARNGGNGTEVMALLFDRRGDQIPITEEVIKAAAGNEQYGKELITLLHQKANFIPSRDIIDVAAANGQEGILLYFKEQLRFDIPSISFSIARFYNAIKAGDETTIRSLLTDNIPTDTKNSKGQSPLWTAARWGHERVIKLLLESPNVDIDARDDNGQSALLCATLHNHLDVAILLLTCGANPTLPDKDGDSLLSIVHSWGNSGSVKLLRSQNHHNQME